MSDPTQTNSLGTDPVFAYSDAAAAKPSNRDDRVAAVANPTFCEKAKGIGKSKTFQAAVWAGAALLALLLAFLLVSNPVGWAATAIGVSLVVAKLIIALGAIAVAGVMPAIYLWKNKEKVSFEWTALFRSYNKRNYDEIKWSGWVNPYPGSLYLGAMLNRRNPSEIAELLGKNGRELAVLSVNQDWEREPIGVSIPPSQSDWYLSNVPYEKIDVVDHTLLTQQQMEKAANWIERQLKAGKNVFVHCRAGVGRSGTAIAAHLMRNGKKADGSPLSIEEICIGIKDSREKATIWDKLGALRRYDHYLRDKHPEIQRPEISDEIHVIANALDEMERQGKKPKIENLEKATRERCEALILKLTADNTAQ